MGPMDFAAIDKCVDERYQRLPTTRTAALKSNGDKITSVSVECREALFVEEAPLYLCMCSDVDSLGNK